jgi:hypothetical protein
MITPLLPVSPISLLVTGLRATVKPHDSCGMRPSLGHFPVVTQFDVCPIGGYNCRIKFVARTTQRSGKSHGLRPY